MSNNGPGAIDSNEGHLNPVKKSPVPDGVSQAEASKLIKEVYGDEWTGATSSEKKRSLAKK